MTAACPLCRFDSARFDVIAGANYFECSGCDFIFADPRLLARADAGEPFRHYDGDYWRIELEDAKARSYGSSLARVAEALLYCSIPVQRFVDIGTGPGFLLDALARYLPAHQSTFHGVEKFPPAPGECSTHPNYLRADLADVGLRFECGTCIEVLEHLTPAMASGLAQAMARVSVPGALFLFNTGLTQYVRIEDRKYLDPYRRGHITSWSVVAARRVFEPAGFAVHPIPGKTWAFAVEYRPAPEIGGGTIRDRIWTVPIENRRLLSDPEMGEVMYLLGLESARAY